MERAMSSEEKAKSTEDSQSHPATESEDSFDHSGTLATSTSENVHHEYKLVSITEMGHGRVTTPSVIIGEQREQELAQLSSDCYQQFVEALGKLPGLSPELAEAYIPADLREDFEHFRLWARNIGANALDEASLDFRLRDQHAIKASIKRQLKSVVDNLSACVDLAYENHDDDAQSTDISDNESISSSGTKDFPIDTDPEYDSIQYQFTSMLADVSATLNRLSQIARAIRRSGLQSRRSRAIGYRHFENGTDMTEKFEHEFLPRVLELAHGLKEPSQVELKSRLCRAITRRRTFFEYSKAHQRRLAYGSHDKSLVSLKTHFEEHIRQSVRLPRRSHEESQRPSVIPLSGRPEQQSIQPTKASEVEGTIEYSRATSVVAGSATSSRILRGFAVIPPPPKVKQRQDYFVCPYCHVMLSRAKLQKSQWREHVLGDLRPYVCVSAECADRDLDFENEAQWIEHQQTHVLEWWCDGDDGKHARKNFKSKEAFKVHCQTEHQKTLHTDQEIKAVLDVTGTPSAEVFNACPFCDFEVASSPQAHARKGAAGTPVEQLKIKAHIVNHLLDLFTHALLERDDIEEADTCTKVKGPENSTIGELEQVHLYFQDNESTEVGTNLDKSIPDADPNCWLDYLNWYSDLEDTKYSPEEDEFLIRFSQMQLVRKQTETQRGRSSSLRVIGTEGGLSPLEATESRKSFERSDRQPNLPCFSVPPHLRSDEFVGRNDTLRALEASVLPPTGIDWQQLPKSRKAFALCGTGGIGKTIVAVEFAYRQREHFDAIFWVSADDRNILAQDFARVAVDLGLQEQDGQQDITVACSLVNEWLMNPCKDPNALDSPNNKANWALIFDNVDDFDVLAPFWPVASAGGSVLITTRHPAAVTREILGIEGRDIDPFSQGEAVEFLRSRIETGDTQFDDVESIANVADKCGGLPLLLSQAAGVMLRLGLTYEEFLDLYEKASIEELSEAATAVTSSERLISISSKLGLGGLHAGSLAILRLITLLNPDRIAEKILLSALSIPESGLPPTKLQYFSARNPLLQSSLIQYDVISKDIWLHRIVQKIVWEQASEEQRLDSLRVAILAISEVWPFQEWTNRFATGRWKDCSEIFPHVLRLKTTYEIMFSAGTCEPSRNAAILFSDAGWYWFERGFAQESKTFFKLVQAICERAELSVKHSFEDLLRESISSQVGAAAESNDPDNAFQCSEIWLDMVTRRRTESGEEVLDYELALVYNERGVAFALCGRFDKALEYLNKSIETTKSLVPYDKTLLGWPQPNVGLVLWIIGRLKEAEVVLLDILHTYEVAYGKDDVLSFRTGKILYALGNVCVSQKRYDEGLEYHQRCLKQYRVTLGEGHHRVGDVCHKLLDHYTYRANFEEALLCSNQAIRIFSSKAYHKNELARTTYKTALLYEKMGRINEANEHFDKTVALRRILVPSDKRSLDELTEHDFDELVAFWSR